MPATYSLLQSSAVYVMLGGGTDGTTGQAGTSHHFQARSEQQVILQMFCIPRHLLKNPLIILLNEKMKNEKLFMWSIGRGKPAWRTEPPTPSGPPTDPQVSPQATPTRSHMETENIAVRLRKFKIIDQ